jgi:hypothetical protein
MSSFLSEEDYMPSKDDTEQKSRIRKSGEWLWRHKSAIPTITTILFALIACLQRDTIAKLDQANLDLEEMKLNLEQGKLNLTAEIQKLEEKLFNFTHPPPEIGILRARDIEIGPPLNGCERICNFSLWIEVEIFTAHEGKFVIFEDCLLLEYNPNWTMAQWGFMADLVVHGDLTYSIGPLNNKTWIRFPFKMYYVFLKQSILKYPIQDIATLGFQLKFYDFITKSFRFEQEFSTRIVWNNQTVLS